MVCVSLVSLCACALWPCGLLFGFSVAQGEVAFLHYRQMETRSQKNQWLHLLSKPSPGAKTEGAGALRRKSRNEGEQRVAGSLSCEKKKNGASRKMKGEL